MFLDKEMIEEITFGVQYIEKNGAGFCFHRMPDKQVEQFAELNAGFALSALSPAGVCFDFYTDSRYLAFTYEVNRHASRGWYSFDLDVNGIALYRFGEPEIIDTAAGKIHIELPQGRNRITVWLPYLVTTKLSDIELSDGASIERVRKNGKLIVYGDSITQGFDAHESRNTYINRIAKALNIEVINLGIGGARFDPIAAAPAKGDAVMIAYGTNDWSHRESRKEFIERTNGFMDKISEYFPDKKVLTVLPIWRADCGRITAVGTFSEAGEIIRDLAKNHHFYVADGLGFIPQQVELFDDRKTHPNDEGTAYYASALFPHVERLLEVNRR